MVRAVAFSKKLVVRDFQAEFSALDKISDLEFFEILGRVVDIQSVGTVMEDQFLHTKIEAILSQFIKIGDPNKGIVHKRRQ